MASALKIKCPTLLKMLEMIFSFCFYDGETNIASLRTDIQNNFVFLERQVFHDGLLHLNISCSS